MDINDLVLSEKALAVIDEGEWIEAGEEAPGLEFLVTGLQAEGARNLMKQKQAKARKANRGKPLSEEQLAAITKEVLAEKVLKDWRGLESDGEELPYSKDLAHKFITSRGGGKFAGLVLFAAQQLDESANSYVESVEKN